MPQLLRHALVAVGFFISFQLLQDERTVVVENVVVLVELDCFVDILQSLYVVLHQAVQVAAVVEVLRIHTVDLYSAGVVLQSLTEPLQFVKDVGTIVVVLPFEGIQCDSLLEGSDGLLVLLELEICKSKKVVGNSHSRIQLNGLVEVGNGLW